MEPREEFGWSDARKFLTDPDSAFERVKDLPLREDVKLLVGHLAFFAVLETVVLLFLQSYGPFTRLFRLVGPGEGAVGLTFNVLLLLGITLPSVFLIAAVIHVGVLILGGRGYRKTLKAVIYGEIPIYYFGWIPIANIVFGIWGLVVTVKGLAKLHGFSGWKAFGAYCLGSVIVFIPLTVVLAAVVAAFVLGLGPSAAGYHSSVPQASIRLVEANASYVCLEHDGGQTLRWTSIQIAAAGRLLGYEGDQDCKAGRGGFDTCKYGAYTRYTGPPRVWDDFEAGDLTVLALGEQIQAGSTIRLIDSTSYQQVASLTVYQVRSGPLLCG